MHRTGKNRFGAAVRYLSLNGLLLAGAAVLLQDVARLWVEAGLMVLPKADSEFTRVEQFKRAEVAAAEAPRVPVQRVLVALEVPDMPVQVLAVRLDQAESLKATPVKIKPPKAKRKLAGRAKVAAKNKKLVDTPIMQLAGQLPPSVVASALLPLEPVAAKRRGKRAADFETSRDITNRSLGVLVALKN